MKLTFDVKKTDSLVEPIIGIINFTTDGRGMGVANGVDWQMLFHWQGDHWTLAQSKIITPMRAPADQLNREIFRTEPMAGFLKSVQ